MIRVFTDTAANLPPEVLEKYHIRTLPLTYRVDGELPEGEFDGPAYYDAIRGGAEVKTAMVNPQDTAEGMEPVLAAGDDLLYIGISGGISGTCWSVGLAADELMAKYPGRQLRVIDSRGASLGEGLIPIEVAKLSLIHIYQQHDVRQLDRRAAAHAGAGRDAVENRPLGRADERAGAGGEVVCVKVDHADPVSYTHLDVYKRQPEG